MGTEDPASYLSYDIQAVHIRQSQIQKDDLRAVGGYRQHGLRPVGSFFIMVSLCLQGGCNQVGDCLFNPPQSEDYVSFPFLSSFLRCIAHIRHAFPAVSGKLSPAHILRLHVKQKAAPFRHVVPHLKLSSVGLHDGTA